MMNQHDITRDALRQANTIWSGGIHGRQSTADGGCYERVAKFNRKARMSRRCINST